MPNKTQSNTFRTPPPVPAKIAVMTNVKKAMTQKAHPTSLAKGLMEQGYQHCCGQYMGVSQGLALLPRKRHLRGPSGQGCPTQSMQ